MNGFVFLFLSAYFLNKTPVFTLVMVEPRYADAVRLSEVDYYLGQFVDPQHPPQQQLISSVPHTEQDDNDQSVQGIINRIFDNCGTETSADMLFPYDEVPELLQQKPDKPADPQSIAALSATGVQLNTELSLRLSNMCTMVEEIQSKIDEKRRMEPIVQNSNEVFQKLLCSLLSQKEKDDRIRNNHLRETRRVSEATNGMDQDALLKVRTDIRDLRKAILEVDHRLLSVGLSNYSAPSFEDACKVPETAARPSELAQAAAPTSPTYNNSDIARLIEMSYSETGGRSQRVSTRDLRRRGKHTKRASKIRIQEIPTEVFVESPSVSEATTPLPPIPSPPFATTSGGGDVQ
eukprot:TRINITY_DN651_c11_g1_i1.p1 TRINITY_DN651_c11_g1~~TRINITY_DN651_c11_g1_i1.p1  ORF type:complete len:348 (+),score=66.01 TRINITY_DN651_c11_g1_i1:181-1224(+)